MHRFLDHSFGRLTSFFNSVPTLGSGGKQTDPPLLELNMVLLIMIPLIALALICAAVPLLET